MALHTLDVIVLALVGLACLIVKNRRLAAKGLRPPGPTCLPVVGNFFQFPTKRRAFYFEKVARKYGGIAMLRLFSSDILVLGDRQLAHQLLVVRSANYFARARQPYLKYVDPHGLMWAASSDKQQVRLGHRLASHALRPVLNGEADALLEHGAHHLVMLFLSIPADWMEHTESANMRTTLELSYGPAYIERGLEAGSELVSVFRGNFAPTSSIMNLVPFLDRVPGLPKPWRQRAVAPRQHIETFNETVLGSLGSGENVPAESWYKTFSRVHGGPLLVPMLAVASVGTTSVAVRNFIIATLMHGQDFYAAAQRQVDNVVGIERPPSLADRSGIPLIDALVREVLRWRAPIAASLGHRAFDDDVIEYKGKTYFIPAGTLVFAAPSAIEHDPKYYDDPEIFNPGRFLDEKGALTPEYHTSAFGYGGRACPGKPLAERTVWINIATIVWTFNIRPESGFRYRDDEHAYVENISCRPLPFPVVFEPRDHCRMDIIQQLSEEYLKNQPLPS